MTDQTPPPPPPSGGYPPPPGGGGHPAPPGGGYGSSGYDLGEAFSWAWRKFTDNVLFLLVGGLILFAIYIAISAIVQIPGQILTSLGDDPRTVGLDRPGLFIAGVLVLVVGGVVFALILIPLIANYLRGVLVIADGQQSDIGRIFRLERVGATIGLYVLIGLGTVVGLILCVLPGITFAIFSLFSIYFLLDRGQGVTQSIGSSFALVRANVGAVFLLWLVTALMNFAGALLCGVGLLLTGPLSLLITAYAYRRLSGGTVAP